MEYTVKLEKRPNRPTAVVRRHANGIAELPKVIPAACGLVWDAVRAGKIVGAGRMVALYHNMSIDLEVGVELDGPAVTEGEIISSEIPGGLIAVTVHMGPYSGLAGAHQAIHRWAKENGHALAGPFWEIYDHWRDEWNTDPSGIRTDICYLAEPSR